MYRILVSFVFIVVLGSTVHAQKVEMKNEKITVDGKDFLSFKFFDTKRELAIYKLNTDEELIYVIYNENQTPGYFNDDYYTITFSGLKLKMETSKWDLWKKTVNWFYQNNLFDSNGNLNVEKVNNFVTKYNEPISEQKIR